MVGAIKMLYAFFSIQFFTMFSPLNAFFIFHASKVDSNPRKGGVKTELSLHAFYDLELAVFLVN